MRRTARLFTLFALLAAPAACSNPAAPVSAVDADASLDGGTVDCRQNGSGSLVECECRQNGSGNLTDCP